MTAARLARLRVPVGFVCGAIALALARPTPRSLAWGAAVAAAGEALRVWAAGHLEKGREVTASGPYRWMRHPLYVGSTLMGAGFAVASARIAVAAVIAVYLATFVSAAVRTEDAFLQARFGDDYRRYRAGETRARRFSIARVVANREYRAVVGLAAVLAWLAWRAGRVA